MVGIARPNGESAAGGTMLSGSIGYTYDAQLVGYDESLDIAVLKIDAQGAPPPGSAIPTRWRWATRPTPSAPMGYLYGTMTDGIISALHVEVDVDGKSMNLIQTSAALNSGNSGGALINDRGQVVGITVAKISGQGGRRPGGGTGPGHPHLGRPALHQLYPGERRDLQARPSGITCSAAVMDGTAGVVIQSVEPDGPAMEAGLQKLDLIVAADGKTVDSIYSLKQGHQRGWAWAGPCP